MVQRYDVIIVGGGFSGVGLLREAAYHGFKALLLETDQLGSGASSASLRIVHGGFRYLQTASFNRVLRSAESLRIALTRYPEFISPVPSLMPLSRFGFKSRLPVSVALKIYHAIAKIPLSRQGRIVSQPELDASVSLLRGLAPNGALQWYDGLVNDPLGLINRIAQEALDHGAEIRTGVTASGISTSTNEATVICSEQSGGESEYKAAVVFNAAGSRIKAVPVPSTKDNSLVWCRAFNLFLDQEFDPNFAIAGTGRGRLLFSVPRKIGSKAGTAVGTWYIRFNPDLYSTTVSEQEIAHAFGDIQAAFPQLNLKLSSVTGVECGVLPVGYIAPNGEPVPLGDEQLLRNQRYFEILSTKFTTFPVQSQFALQAAAAYLPRQ